jgi:tRNA(His) 5'-end guanylyltransferase
VEKRSLGDRMKENYEQAYSISLPMRMPLVIRLDGKAFHTLTRKFQKPFSIDMILWMNHTALYLCQNIQGCQLAYVQSDEISLLIHNYKHLNSNSWFDNKIQKMVSVAAGMASSVFTLESQTLACFDARAFILPENEVANYFIWRQKDWERNSIQMLAQSLYSYKQLHKKKNDELQELCFQKGQNWNDLATYLKRGRCAKRIGEEWQIDNEMPILTQDRDYVDNLLKVEEEK